MEIPPYTVPPHTALTHHHSSVIQTSVYFIVFTMEIVCLIDMVARRLHYFS